MGKKSTSGVVKLAPVKVTTLIEQWSEYELDDGTKVKVRPVIVEVERHVGKLSPEGKPIYQIKAGAIIDVKAQDKVKKPKKKKQK